MITPEERARWLTEARDSNEYFTPNIQRLIAALNALEESERQADRLAEVVGRNFPCNFGTYRCPARKHCVQGLDVEDCKAQLLAWAGREVEDEL